MKQFSNFAMNHLSSYKILLALIVMLAAVIRFYGVSNNPPGLYIDEVSNAYNAYSILTTGLDEHGVRYPLWFEAFGEYKMPVMIYLIVGAMAVLGKTDLAVRLPSIVAGILTVPMLFFLLRELLNGKSNEQPSKKKQIQISNRQNKQLILGETKWLMQIPLLSAFILAVSPWHIHFSRGGFEATIALFLITTSIMLFLRYRTQKRGFLLFGCIIFAVLSIYTYNTYRIIVPLLFIVGAGVFLLDSRRSLKHFFAAVFLTILCVIPAIVFSVSPEGNVRFAQTSALAQFQDDSFKEKVQLMPIELIRNYVSAFSTNFLFNVGDYNGRHQVPGFGLFFKWQMALVVIGAFVLTMKKDKKLILLIGILLIIAPIPAALTVPSPHSLRSLMMVLPLSIVGGIGIAKLFGILSEKKRIVFILFCIAALGETIVFGHHYVEHYTRTNILDWGAGYKDVVAVTEKHKDKYDYIVIDKNLGNDTLMYFKYYGSSLSPEMIDTAWSRPEYMEGKRVLLIRPDYREAQKIDLIDQVKLPNQNNDVFAEFYLL